MAGWYHAAALNFRPVLQVISVFESDLQRFHCARWEAGTPDITTRMGGPIGAVATAAPDSVRQ
jgi:hypothetical protein